MVIVDTLDRSFLNAIDTRRCVLLLQNRLESDVTERVLLGILWNDDIITSCFKLSLLVLSTRRV